MAVSPSVSTYTAERCRVVTARALPAEAAEMHVVMLVAADALHRGLHRVGRFPMTRRAIQFRVRAGQLEVGGLAVVELPQRPAIRVMAIVAAFAERTLVFVLAAVAGIALDRGRGEIA